MDGLTPDAVFAKVARRYDRLNRILSLGRDQAWRRSVARELPPGRLLDLGAGTGAALGLFGRHEVVALDPAPAMLSLNPAGCRVVGRGEGLPFADQSFDGVFSAFVMRNLDSVEGTLWEMSRVLRPGGRVGIVGLGRPSSSFWAGIHRVATAMVVPVAGAFIGAAKEYRYLHESLDSLPAPEQLYKQSPLPVVKMWRMGPFGFAYGVILAKN